MKTLLYVIALAALPLHLLYPTEEAPQLSQEEFIALACHPETLEILAARPNLNRTLEAQVLRGRLERCSRFAQEYFLRCIQDSKSPEYCRFLRKALLIRHKHTHPK